MCFSIIHQNMLENMLFSSISKVDTDMQSILLSLRLLITPAHLTYNLHGNISSFFTYGNNKEMNFASNNNAKLHNFSSLTKPQALKPGISSSMFFILRPVIPQTFKLLGYLHLLRRPSILVQPHARLVELPQILNIARPFQVQNKINLKVNTNKQVSVFFDS